MAGNVFDDDLPEECPLCMEAFGLDDINFFPCACRYQICRFCWHRIRTDENGLCPHCREPYSENPAEYTPLTQEQLSKLKSEKRQKTTERKQKLVENRKSLADVRVIQKNLVFVVGLSPRLADPETLRKNEYFGKYGRIFKVVINNHTVYNGTQGPSVSAYVTFHREEDALKAISAVNNAFIDGRYLKASFGTTKYCTTFLRGSQCTKPDCMYLHALGDNEASFTKEDMHLGKHQVYEQSALAAANLDPKENPSDSSVLGGVSGVSVGVSSGGVKVKPVQSTVPKVPLLMDVGEGSALPSTASWASSTQLPSVQTVPLSKDSKPHSSSKTSKHTQQRSLQNHSPKSSTVTSSPKSISHASQTRQSSKSKREQKESTSKPDSPDPSFVPMEHTSLGARRTQRHDSVDSKESLSSKSWTPNLSPKSTLSKTPSTDSLNCDSISNSPDFMLNMPAPCIESDFGQPLPEQQIEDTAPTLEPVARMDTTNVNVKTIDPISDDYVLPDVSLVPTGTREPHHTVQPASQSTSVQSLAPPVTNSNVFAVNLSESEYKILQEDQPGEGLVAVSREMEYDRSTRELVVPVCRAQLQAGNDGDVLNVLSGLGSAGSGQFGSLGVSWNSQVPSTLTENTPTPKGTKALSSQQEDDLGFDPWDVSQQGLADLLETEAEEQRKPFTARSRSHTTKPKIHSGLTNGVSDHGQTFLSSTGMPNSSLGVSCKGGVSDPWKDELRTLFPDVNISFGGRGPGFPSTATKAKPDKPSSSSLHQAVDAMHLSTTTAAYHPSQLANALNYSYNPPQGTTSVSQLRTSSSSSQSPGLPSDLKSTFSGSNRQVTGSNFPIRGFPASSTKVLSGGYGLPAGSGRVGLGSSDWPGFGDGALTASVKKTGKETEVKESDSLRTLPPSSTATPLTTATPSLPSPPPGFGAKSAFSSVSTNTSTSRNVSKGVTPSTVSMGSGSTSTTGVAGGSLSSSVNHALWANTQAQGKGHVVPNHLLQSWNNFLNFSALTPAQQQQLARNSQNYQNLIAQQYLLMQSFLMRGYPMIQAQAQAQAQIQASLRAQLQQHALRQQQQQQQQAGLAVAGVVSASGSVPSMVKGGPTGAAQSTKVNSSVVSTISSGEASSNAVTLHQSSSTTDSTTTHSNTNAIGRNNSVQHNGRQSGLTSKVSSSKHSNSATNSSTSTKVAHHNHHHHHVSSKNKTASSHGTNKQTKSSISHSATSSGTSEKRAKHKNTAK